MADFTKVQQALERRGYTVRTFAAAEEAAAYLDGAIDGKTVGFGGSATLDALGVYDKLAAHNTVIWHWKQEANAARKAAMQTQVYLSSANGLAEHGRLSGSAQPEDQTDAVALLAVEILLQLLKAITKSPVLYALRHGLQTPAGNHAGFKIQLGLVRFRHAGLQFLQLSLKRLAPINLFLQYLHLSISKILAVLFSVLCPLMVVSDFAVDRLL